MVELKRAPEPTTDPIKKRKTEEKSSFEQQLEDLYSKTDQGRSC